VDAPTEEMMILASPQVLEAYDADREAAIAEHMQSILRILGVEGTVHTADTPKRWAKMMLREVCAGLITEPPAIASFDLDRDEAVAIEGQINVVGPIALRSCCAHHLVPIVGSAWIGLMPNTKQLNGLSKLHRLTEWVMARPSVQETATAMLADAIEELMHPVGLAVVVRAKHFCCAWRGVKDEPSVMITSMRRGLMRTNLNALAEFMTLISGAGY
jgi:GTP cyclohydrolase IA